MPSISFDGFALGSAVSISAAQGVNNTSNSVSTWGQTSVASASAEISFVGVGELVAPATVRFRATNLAGFDVSEPAPGTPVDPTHSKITYIWGFGDPGSFDAPENLVTGWNDKNAAYGKEVTHVFETPGTYTPTLFAVDRSGNETPVISGPPIVVRAPDIEYAGARTICFSQAGDFTGAPSGATLVTSWSNLQAAASAQSQTHRILFRAGEAFALPTWHTWDNNPNLRCGSFGSGAKPVLRSLDLRGWIFRNSGNPVGVSEIVFESLRFEGGWDAVTETGIPTPSPFSYSGGNQPGFRSSCVKCEFSGFSEVIVDMQGTGASSVFWDCDVTNWNSYGFYVSLPADSYLALLGCKIVQPVDALEGEAGIQYLGNSHGGARIPDCRNVQIDACDTFGRAGWSADSLGQPAVQPGFRINTNGQPGVNLTCTRTVCENGVLLFSMTPENGGWSANPGNYLLDHVLLIGTPRTGVGIRAAFGGMTIRNLIYAHPQVPSALDRFDEVIVFDSVTYPQGPGNLDAAVEIYNVSIIYLPALAGSYDAAFIAGDEALTNAVYENNIFHAPSQSSPATGDGPINLSATIPGVQPRYAGTRVSPPAQQGTLSAAVAQGSFVDLPYPPGADQAYFLAHPSQTHHAIKVGGSTYRQAAGEIGVSFANPGFVRVTNTSFEPWSSGNFWQMRLDRRSQLSGLNGTYANPGSLPLPRPESGSAAYQVGANSLRAQTDFFTQPRPGSKIPGAPSGVPAGGAVEPV